MNGPRPAARQRATEATPAARNLSEWLRQLERLIRAARSLGPDSGGTRSQCARLVENFASLLEYHAPLVLRITPIEVWLRDELVFRPAGADEGEAELEQRLPFLLYRDGIRGLVFDENATRNDARALLDALVRVVSQPASDEDLVSLLWETDLDGMRVELAPLDQLAVRPPANPAQRPAREAPPAALVPPGTRPADAADAWRALAEGEQAEFDAWHERWQIETSRCWPERIEALIAAALAADGHDATRETLAGSIASDLAAALQRCDWAAVTHSLDHLRALDGERRWTPALLTEVFGAADARTLSDRLDEASNEEQARFFSLAVRVGRPALDLVVRVLGRATRSRVRAAATTVLAYTCADDPRALAPWLRDSRWHVARNIVFALGQIGGEDIVAPLGQALRHFDGRVRRAAVAALGQVPTHRRTPLLVEQLGATDPPTLAAVLAMLAREPDPRATAALIETLAHADFEARPEDARVALIGALGECADDRALAVLEPIVHMGGWFARPTPERSAAAHAIARVGTTRAIETLERGLRGRSEAARTACQDALTRRWRAA